MVNVNLVEFVWVLLTTVGVALTVSALNDARADRDTVKALKGPASLELAATTIVIGERFRLLLQLVLFSIAIPGLFSDRETNLTPVVVSLMAVPVLLLAWSWRDAGARKRMAGLVTKEALETRADDFAEIKTMLAHNTEVSAEAVIEARKAYHEANDVNQKIASQGAALVQQGEDRATAAERLETTVDSTAEQVSDLHAGTAPEGAS